MLTHCVPIGSGGGFALIFCNDSLLMSNTLNENAEQGRQWVFG